MCVPRFLRGPSVQAIQITDFPTKNIRFWVFLSQKMAFDKKDTIYVAGLVQLELSHKVQQLLRVQQKVIFMVVERGRVNNVSYPK